jgi:hypothetical protein
MIQGIVVSNDVVVSMEIDGLDNAKAVQIAISYAINNCPDLSAAQKSALTPARDALTAIVGA